MGWSEYQVGCRKWLRGEEGSVLAGEVAKTIEEAESGPEGNEET